MDSTSATRPGKLYLIPTPLSENGLHTIPPYVVQIIHALRYFIVERAKTARHFIKSTNPPYPISAVEIVELNEHTLPHELRDLLTPVLSGADAGLASEAGCPGVADPGAALVALAHQLKIEIVPLVGPSSILLALMASGLNGQQFCFLGYLSAKKDELDKELKKLEQAARKSGQTQIFIETPYRNHFMAQQIFQTLASDTLLCIAVDLTAPAESVQTKSIIQWKKSPLPDINKHPAIFLVGFEKRGPGKPGNE